MLDAAALRGDAGHVADLASRFETATAEQRILAAFEMFRERIALVSSFGADSAVLLHMVSQINAAAPVIFIDTGHLFPETLAYRDRLVARFGLTGVRTCRSDERDLTEADPDLFLWSSDPDSCCRVRKTLPLARALDGFQAWISGRKRYQASTREALPVFEAAGGLIKVNPLADWSSRHVLDYMTAHDLPRHELVAKRYLSIGCIPCTSQVRPGESARAGRWRGQAKTECGIHTDFVHAGDGI